MKDRSTHGGLRGGEREAKRDGDTERLSRRFDFHIAKLGQAGAVYCLALRSLYG